MIGDGGARRVRLLHAEYHLLWPSWGGIGEREQKYCQRSAQPRNHTEVDGVALGDLGQRLAGSTALDSFLALTSEQYQAVRAESPTMTSMAADSFTFPAACASRGLIERALERPEDRGLSDLVVAGKLRHGLAGGIPLGDLALLGDIERGGSTELLAILARLGDAGLGAAQDQAPLELGDAGHDRDDQLANIGGGVAPGLAEANEAAGAFL